MTELSEAELDELVEQAIVDAYGDDEQLVGLYTMIDDNLALPFTTTVLGVEADVVRVDVTDSGIVAICVRGADVRRSRSSTSASRFPLHGICVERAESEPPEQQHQRRYQAAYAVDDEGGRAGYVPDQPAEVLAEEAGDEG